MARPFSVRLDGRRITVVGELDLSTARTFEARLDDITEGSGDVVVDASDLDFVDSSGVRALFALVRRLDRRGRVVIANPTDQVRRVLDLVHGDAMFEIRVEPRPDDA